MGISPSFIDFSQNLGGARHAGKWEQGLLQQAYVANLDRLVCFLFFLAKVKMTREM